MSVPVVIALGGNLGDVRRTAETALAELGRTPGVEVMQVSRWYFTEPVGCEGRFLNAAARLRSELTPTQLLLRLQGIETAHGRQRTGHWTPRPLDLDIVLFGQWQLEHPQLKLPHPAAWMRRFVLDPACEVGGTQRHPGLGLTLHQLRERLLPRPLDVSWRAEHPLRTVIDGEIQDRFGSQIRWVEVDRPAIVRFVSSTPSPRAPFEIAIGGEKADARRTVKEALTALLDEPQIAE